MKPSPSLRSIAKISVLALLFLFLPSTNFRQQGASLVPKAEAATCSNRNHGSLTIGNRNGPFKVGRFVRESRWYIHGQHMIGAQSPRLAASGLQGGDIVYPSAWGRINWYHSDGAGPEGAGWSHGSLIHGIVGQWTNNSNSVIGDGFHIHFPNGGMTVPSGATRLWVAYGDNDYSDNSGSYGFSSWSKRCYPQCKDGIDNDGDGAKDYPADFSCSSSNDDNEANPLAQCQDGTDNDNDGTTDYPADVSCSSRQDNDEYSPPAQCDDGLDNDTDGLADYPWDPGCSNTGDNDETDPGTLPQCGDGTDNDNDSLVDFLFDPGCSAASDDDELDTLPVPQCTDLADNDADSQIDFPVDPGCLYASDDDETDSLCYGSGGLNIDSMLVSWWSGDGHTNDEQDGNNGTLVGGATFAAGQVDSAFSFDGAGDYVNVPDAANLRLGSNQTVDAWIYPTANLSGWARIVGKGYSTTRNYSLWRHKNGYLYFGMYGQGSTYCSAWSDGDADTIAPINTWTHVAGTYDGSRAKLYVNGNLEINIPCTITPRVSSYPLRIGSENNRYYFKGLIDEVEVFNQALPAGTIQAIYNAGSRERGCNEECYDGSDNDGDGYIDFPWDPGCLTPVDDDETNQPVPPQCSDSADNDLDGLVDFPSDPGCSFAADNDETNPAGTPECVDTLDNEGDGWTDFPNDPGCYAASDNSEYDPATLPQCYDNSDNDGDGQIDYPADPGCISRSDSNETDTFQCNDGVDNDGDGTVGNSGIDYALDFSCSSRSDNDESTPLAACQDGSDNDLDTFTDYPADPECGSPQDDDESILSACSDGMDNDGDGFVDFGADPGCVTVPDPNEFNTYQCNDTVDNDFDGAIDYPVDFSCSSATDNDEVNPLAGCEDGLDNDGDTFIDFPLDLDCSSRQDNSEAAIT